jgi:hypothetical protein
MQQRRLGRASGERYAGARSRHRDGIALAAEIWAAYQRLDIDPVIGDCVLFRQNPAVSTT